MPTKLITTSAPYTAAIAESVRRFNNPSIYMVGDELYSSLEDLSDFWAAHRQWLQEEVSEPYKILAEYHKRYQ